MNTDKVSEMLNNRILSEKAAYSDEGVALFESTDRMTTVRNVNIDALLLGLCQSGHATLTIDGVEHEVSTYDLLVCLPGMTISRSETSGDICGCCICMSKDYVQQLSQMNSGDLWNAILFLSKNPVLRLEPSEAQSFKMYYDIIKAKINRQDRRYGKKLVETLFQACLYDFTGCSSVSSTRSNGRTIRPRRCSATSSACCRLHIRGRAVWPSMPTNCASRPSIFRPYASR